MEVACGNSPRYRFRPITDDNIVTEVLESVGLENEGNSDLVALEGTRRNQLFPTHFEDYNRYRHVLYVTEDVNTRYLDSNYELPGQALPCRCKGLYLAEQDNDEYATQRAREQSVFEGVFGSSHDAHCHFHHGAEVVFVRSKLEDTLLAQSLDRFWIDWVSIDVFCLALFFSIARISSSKPAN